MTHPINIPQARALLAIYPELGTLATVPDFVETLRDDWWLDSIEPWLAIPDIFGDEDASWERLVAAIPEMAEFDLPIPEDSRGDAQLAARAARRGAIRSIAVAMGLGSQTFTPHPLLGGEGSLRVQPYKGLHCRIGMVASTNWKASPSAVSRAVTEIREKGGLELLARRILPLLESDNYETEFLRWVSVKPLREWEATHRLPLVARPATIPVVPVGYHARYDLKNTGGIPGETAAVIAAPYAAPVLRETRLALAPDVPPPSELLEWALARCPMGGT